MKKAIKTLRNIVCCFILLMIVSTTFSPVYAGFFEDASKWWDKGGTDAGMSNAMSSITSEIGDYVRIVGTVVIVIATIVLGVRYIFASAEGKTAAKENAMNLLVACILFFGWSNISKLLYTGTEFAFHANTFESAVGTVFAVFKFLAEAIALVGILYVGIKYIFAGAEGKADLKSKSFPFIIGIILTFAAVEVLNIISNIITETV
ncbi:MAG: hypothetical protein J6A15_02040 [Clostridia bacterium]|nr:hypothetical protein [Clostridia bacterium]